MKLYKFYDFLDRNAIITLTNEDLTKVYYEDAMKSIPDKFDDCTVIDFAVSNDGDVLFKVTF